MSYTYFLRLWKLQNLESDMGVYHLLALFPQYFYTFTMYITILLQSAAPFFHKWQGLKFIQTWNSRVSFFSIQSVIWLIVTSLSPTLGRATSHNCGFPRKPYLKSMEYHASVEQSSHAILNHIPLRYFFSNASGRKSFILLLL